MAQIDLIVLIRAIRVIWMIKKKPSREFLPGTLGKEAPPYEGSNECTREKSCVVNKGPRLRERRNTR